MTAVEQWDISSLQASPWRKRRESLVQRTAFGTAFVSVLISALIVYALVFEAWAFMREVDWANTWGQLGWFPRRNLFDLPTILVASLSVTAIAMVVATPLGLGAAVYLSEYASPRLRRILKPVLEVLAGIPSVVLGYFALRFIAPSIISNLFESAAPANLAAAGVGVGLLTIPLIASISEDALAAVPRSLREASVGLGARKMATRPGWWLPSCERRDRRRPSSSPSPEPSARRWWCSSPAVPPTAPCAASTLSTRD